MWVNAFTYLAIRTLVICNRKIIHINLSDKEEAIGSYKHNM